MLSDLCTAPEWQEKAACVRVADPDRTFFRGEAGAARRYCNKCPVRQECLDFSVRLQIEYGVWGGLTAQQRRSMFSHERRPYQTVAIDRTRQQHADIPVSVSPDGLQMMVRLIRISYEPQRLRAA